MCRILIFLIFFISLQSNAQMHKWEMNTFKNAEKSRKWRSRRTVSFLWTRSKRPRKDRKKKFTYGQITNGPRNSRGKR